jgi:hypothetical protein
MSVMPPVMRREYRAELRKGMRNKLATQGFLGSKEKSIMAVTRPSEHPKSEPVSNAEKPPEDWTTGDEPMTGAQASYLKTLSEEAHDDDAYDNELTTAEASLRIDELLERTGRGQ